MRAFCEKLEEHGHTLTDLRHTRDEIEPLNGRTTKKRRCSIRGHKYYRAATDEIPLV